MLVVRCGSRAGPGSGAVQNLLIPGSAEALRKVCVPSFFLEGDFGAGTISMMRSQLTDEGTIKKRYFVVGGWRGFSSALALVEITK